MSDNTFKLYVNCVDAITALRSMASLVEPTPDMGVAVTLLAEEAFTFPARSAYSAKVPRQLQRSIVVPQDGTQVLFETDLNLAVDYSIHRWLQEVETIGQSRSTVVPARYSQRNRNQAVLASAYICIRLGMNFAEIELSPSSLEMSNVLSRSTTITKELLRVLREANGDIALFYDDSKNLHHFLDDSQRPIPIDIYHFYDQEHDSLDVDRWVAALMALKTKPSTNLQ